MEFGIFGALISQAPTAALALVLLWFFISGKIHSESEYQQARKDLETEKAAHAQTRAAYELASARADAGIRAAELVAAAVEGVQHAQLPHVPPPQA